MAYYTYNEKTGLIIPDTSTIKTDVENEFKSQFGTDLSVEASTPQGRLIEMETLSRTDTIGICALFANQINVNYATGQILDAIGAFFGVARIGATRTRVLATLSGVSGTTIASGSLAKTSAGDIFYLENNATIESSGTTTAYFLSQELGSIPCVLNTLTTIVSQAIGWETINNPASATIGVEEEGDFDYRKRIDSVRYKGVSLLLAIKSKLASVENLVDSFVYDNPTDSAITYQTISIPAHSLLVVADGGTDLDVATAIFDTKSGGCGYTAITGQSVSQIVVDGAYGASYNVIFNRPEVIDFEVSISVKNQGYTGSDLEQDVKNAIMSWANGDVENVKGLGIGVSVSPFEIGSAVSDLIPTVYIQSVGVCLTGGTPAATELTCIISQKYSISESDITVVIT